MREKWTEQSIPDLSGKVIVVTGGSSGLGFEASKMFAKKGATVVIASRNLERCNKAKNELLNDYEEASVDVFQLDLGNFDSIDLFVKEFTSKYDRLDILLNNAGVMLTPDVKTDSGFELQNGINHLGHFVLTAKLFDFINQTKGSRIVNVSSIAHRFGKINFDDYLYEKTKFDSKRSYARSKLANLLFTYELVKKVKQSDKQVTVLAAHPGVSHTNLGRHLRKSKIAWLTNPIFDAITQDAYTGALPLVRACVDKEVKPGEFYGPRGLFQTRGLPKKVNSNRRSKNVQDQERFWKLSQDITGIVFEV